MGMCCVRESQKVIETTVLEDGRRELYPGAYVPVFCTVIMSWELNQMKHRFWREHFNVTLSARSDLWTNPYVTIMIWKENMLVCKDALENKTKQKWKETWDFFPLSRIAFSTSSGTRAVLSETLALARPSRCQIRYILLHYLGILLCIKGSMHLQTERERE